MRVVVWRWGDGLFSADNKGNDKWKQQRSICFSIFSASLEFSLDVGWTQHSGKKKQKTNNKWGTDKTSSIGSRDLTSGVPNASLVYLQPYSFCSTANQLLTKAVDAVRLTSCPWMFYVSLELLSQSPDSMASFPPTDPSHSASVSSRTGADVTATFYMLSDSELVCF